MSAAPVDVLRRAGFIDATIEDITKNPKVQGKVLEFLKAAGVESSGCDAATGNLLYSAATRLKESSERFRPALARYIASGALKSNPQVSRCIENRVCSSHVRSLCGCALHSLTPLWIS